MGVDLSSIVVSNRRALGDFRGRVLAVDAFNTLYQFLAIIRQPDGTPLRDRRGRVTSHLSGLIYRTGNFVEAGIRPVFVFDGEPPKLKARTIEGRSRVKVQAERAWREALEVGDIETARTKAMQTSRLTPEMVDQSRQLLEGLGIPWVQAPGEGEAQASWMVRRGLAYGVASQDYDALLFGSPVLVKNLAITGRRKLPRKNVFVDVEPEEIRLQDVLGALSLTREQLVDLGILIGTDFNEGIRGIGPKKGLALIREHGDAEAVLAKLDKGIEHLDEVRKIFLEPSATENVRPTWAPPDAERVFAMLVDEFDFSRTRIESTLSKFRAAHGAGRQRSLDSWT